MCYDNNLNNNNNQKDIKFFMNYFLILTFFFNEVIAKFSGSTTDRRLFPSFVPPLLSELYAWSDIWRRKERERG